MLYPKMGGGGRRNGEARAAESRPCRNSQVAPRHHRHEREVGRRFTITLTMTPRSLVAGAPYRIAIDTSVRRPLI